MNRYLETFFRYWLIALVPLVMLPLVEYKNVRHLPHQVNASLNIYAEALPGSDPSSSYTYVVPAQVEVATINQWLQSPSFCLSVAKSSSLYAGLLTKSANPLTQAYNDLAKNVQVVAKGDNLVTISYTSTDPQLAMQVVQHVLDRATEMSKALRLQQVSGSKSYYSYQLYLAQGQERQSAANLTSYMQQHGITSANLVAQMASDPTLAGLFEQNKSDHDNVTSLSNKIQSLQAQASIPANVANQNGFVLADPPQYYTVSSRKQQLMGLGIALGLGLLLSIVFVTLLTARDRSLRQPEEVPTVLEMPVLAILPYSREFARSKVGTADIGNHDAPPARTKRADVS